MTSATVRYHQPIAHANDLHLSIIPNLLVLSTDILNTATRLHLSATATSNQPTSIMGMSTQRGNNRNGRSSRGQQSSGRGTGQATSLTNLPADSWGAKHLTPEFPCQVCWEWGHWALDCP
jgi:hypothetical protein